LVILMLLWLWRVGVGITWSLCPECMDKIVVWNVRDPYFMDREDVWRVYEQIKEKVAELTKSL
jgi:protein-tyrosine-phosphatase